MSKICTPMFVGVVFPSALLLGCTSFVEAEPSGSTSVAGATSTTADGSASEMGTEEGTANGTTTPGTSAGPQTTVDPNEDDGGESSGAEDAAVCGDGVTEDDEACDDGNLDDADGCTANCELTSCRDGVQNGNETALDCGGDCQADCDVGEGCDEGDDCTEGVCGRGVCAAPTCNDGVRNNGEVTPDCGPVCNTAPANVIINGGFESSTDDWVVESPEINPQDAYFGDGSTNRVVEIDRAGNTTSRWQQGFQVPDDQVGLTLVLRFRAGDRANAADDEGGLLVRITGPDTMPLPLTGMAGANFDNNGTTQLGVDATAVADFRTVIVHFQPTDGGGHVLELLEQTDGGVGLNDGGGLVMDDVEVLLVNCEAQ